MKRCACFLLGALVAFGVGCSENKSTEPTEPDDSLLASETIGPEGGTLEVDGFSLVIPAGAFDSDADLTLYGSSDEHGFGTRSVSRLFRLEGFPEAYSEPIRIEIAYDGTLSEESFIALGKNAIMPGSDSIDVAYSVLSAADSSGYLVSELPVPEESPGMCRAEFHKTGTDEGEGEEILRLIGITDMRTYKSSLSGAHFAITYPSYLTNIVVPHIGDYLEDAYDVYQQMGFDFEREVEDLRLDWPIKVLVRDLGDDKVFAKGSFNWYFWIGLHQAVSWHTFKMEFNEGRMNQANLPMLRVAAGREFFRVIPCLYGNSPTIQVAFDEAVGAWCEAKFTDEVNYVPPDFVGHEMGPFQGLFAITLESVRHQLGACALVEYIVRHYGQETLVTTYEERASGDILEGEALIKTLSSPPRVWLPDFFREYIDGEIYGVGDATVTNAQNASGIFHITSDEDTVEFYTANYANLSGRIYHVNLPLEPGNLDESSELKFVVNSVEIGFDDMSLLLYELRNGALYNIDSWTVTNVRELVERGSDLIGVVVNSEYYGVNADRTPTAELKIELTTEEELPYNWCRIDLYTHIHFETSDTNEFWQDRLCSWEGEGSFSDNTFCATWSGVQQGGFLVSGSMGVTIDPEDLDVISFEATKTAVASGAGVTEIASVTGTDVIFSELDSLPNPFLSCKREGGSTCSSISTFEYEYQIDNEIWEDYWERRKEHTCADTSYIRIVLWEWWDR